MACAVGDRYYIINEGRTVLNGEVDELYRNEELQRKYLGGMGSFYGSAVGSIILSLTVALVSWFYPPLTVYSTVLLLILVLTLKPEGLFGLAVKR